MNKKQAERNQKILLELASKPGNDTCADCKNRNPRWASHNLGIFICVSCASIHRSMGTHISKVRSLTLDSWTKEQVEVMKQNGNIKSNAYYNPNETRHPPPANLMDGERDSEMEQYIRSKYEYKKFLEKTPTAASGTKSSRATSSSLSPRSDSTPTASVTASSTRSISRSPANTSTSVQLTTPTSTSNVSRAPPPRSAPQPSPQPPAPAAQPKPPSNAKPTVWDDLVSLQEPGQSSSLPLQFASAPTPASFPNTMGMNTSGAVPTLGNSFQQTQFQQQPYAFNSNTSTENPFPQQPFVTGNPAFGSQPASFQQQYFQPQPQQPLQTQPTNPFLLQQRGVSPSPFVNVGGSPSPFVGTPPSPYVGGTPSPFAAPPSPFGQQQIYLQQTQQQQQQHPSPFSQPQNLPTFLSQPPIPQFPQQQQQQQQFGQYSQQPVFPPGSNYAGWAQGPQYPGSQY